VRGGKLAKAQAVQQRYRPCPHGKHVAHDAAHPGSRALIGLDGRGVVMALNLKNYCLPIANVYYASVFARANKDARAGGGELAEG